MTATAMSCPDDIISQGFSPSVESYILFALSSEVFPEPQEVVVGVTFRAVT